MARTKGKEVAEKLSDFVNSSFGSERVEFVEKVVSDHRYLQNEMFKLFEGCLQEWAVAYESNKYDYRNTEACQKASVMIKALKDAGLY